MNSFHLRFLVLAPCCSIFAKDKPVAMKKLIILAILFSSALCINAQVNTLDSIAKNIVGEWDWRVSSGGITGGWYTPENTKHKEKLIFLKNDSVEHYYDGALVSKSPYLIRKDKGITSLDSLDCVLMNAQRYSVRLSYDTLFMIHEVYDGFNNIYVKNNTGVTTPSNDQREMCSIYPNPCQNILHVRTYDSSLKTITLYSAIGKIVFTKTFTDGLLDLSSLNKGLYLIRLSNGDKTISTKLLKN